MFPSVHWLIYVRKGLGQHRRANLTGFFFLNGCITRAIIRAYLIWCDSLRQLVLLLSVTAATVCTTERVPSEQSSHPGRGKYYSKTLAHLFFFLIILHPRYYIRVLACSCSLQCSPRYRPPLRLGLLLLSGAPSSLEVALAAPEVPVMVSVPTAGMLGEPYAVC